MVGPCIPALAALASVVILEATFEVRMFEPVLLIESRDQNRSLAIYISTKPHVMLHLLYIRNVSLLDSEEVHRSDIEVDQRASQSSFYKQSWKFMVAAVRLCVYGVLTKVWLGYFIVNKGVICDKSVTENQIVFFLFVEAPFRNNQSKARKQEQQQAVSKKPAEHCGSSSFSQFSSWKQWNTKPAI